MDPGRAFAHAAYESSNPGDGETVAEPPEQVEVFFSQELARSGGLPSLIVVNEAGDQVDLGATLDDADRTRVVVDLPPGLPEGRYTVIWHTLSDEDGEEAQGAFHFFIGEPTGETPSPPGETTPPPTDAPATTPPPGDGEDDDGDDGIEPWLAGAATVIALVVGAAGGMAFGRRAET
jgi:methionine-rich copper-binding protein CopC